MSPQHVWMIPSRIPGFQTRTGLMQCRFLKCYQVLSSYEEYYDDTKRSKQPMAKNDTSHNTRSSLCWLLPSKVARKGCYCAKNPLSFSTLPCKGIVLGTSVYKIGESRQYNRSHLPSCLHEKLHRLGNSRTAKPMLNELTYAYLINQVEK
jgi:hypothetical protein